MSQFTFLAATQAGRAPDKSAALKFAASHTG